MCVEDHSGSDADVECFAVRPIFPPGRITSAPATHAGAFSLRPLTRPPFRINRIHKTCRTLRAPLAASGNRWLCGSGRCSPSPCRRTTFDPAAASGNHPRCHKAGPRPPARQAISSGGVCPTCACCRASHRRAGRVFGVYSMTSSAAATRPEKSRLDSTKPGGGEPTNAAHVKKALANSEPPTHGTKPTWPSGCETAAIRSQADNKYSM
jgi:hypothetical protein